jgi:hypothetical protein
MIVPPAPCRGPRRGSSSAPSAPAPPPAGQEPTLPHRKTPLRQSSRKQALYILIFVVITGIINRHSTMMSAYTRMVKFKNKKWHNQKKIFEIQFPDTA